MKYIRTQEGIAEDAGTDALGFRCVRYKRYKVVLSQEDDVIVKEADTIEELCDAFIYEEECKSGLKRHIVTEDIKIGTEYGAIWTEWGLKYVAKMNEKGDWELL